MDHDEQAAIKLLAEVAQDMRNGFGVIADFTEKLDRLPRVGGHAVNNITTDGRGLRRAEIAAVVAGTVAVMLVPIACTVALWLTNRIQVNEALLYQQSGRIAKLEALLAQHPPEKPK